MATATAYPTSHATWRDRSAVCSTGCDAACSSAVRTGSCCRMVSASAAGLAIPSLPPTASVYRQLSTRGREIGVGLLRRRLIVVLVVPAGDLATRREPDAIVAGDVLQRAVEPFRAERMPGEVRVQRQCHHAPAVLALGVQHVELVADHLAKLLGGESLAHEDGDVIELLRVGDGDHA